MAAFGLFLNMKRTTGLFMTALFLIVQMLSLLHMAEHCFAVHEHDGHVCSIYLHCERAKCVDITPQADLQVQIFVEIRPQIPTADLPVGDIFDRPSARAPPAFLPS